MQTRASIPVVAIGLITLIPALLALIYIGSSTVFEDVVSLSTSGLYASYFIACSLLLWRRLTGQILTPAPAQDISDTETALANINGGTTNINKHPPNCRSVDFPDNEGEVIAAPKLIWGPWRLPGWIGIANNVYACVYILFVLFWSFWPPEYPATAKTMNYSVLMTGAVLTFSVIYYFLRGKEQYLGPLVEREVRAMAEKAL